VSPSHNPKYKLLLQRLKDSRRSCGLTQAEVAQQLGQRQSYISKIERNENTLDPVELWELARVYGQPVAYYLDFELEAEITGDIRDDRESDKKSD
jgi:transcriptional regulator with XRE-family HTH domain